MKTGPGPALPTPLAERVRQIVAVVQDVSDALDVFAPRGQGAGNRVTNAAVAEINRRVSATLGGDVAQRVLCAGNRQSVDFYLEAEQTIVELEYSLSNPFPCLEKDLFKVLLAKDAGVAVRTLVLVGDPGCQKRLSAAAPRAIMSWAARVHGIEVAVVALVVRSRHD